MSKLYVVATPIGNLEEVSPRAIKTFELVDVLICEDTRVTKHLLQLLNIDYSKKTFISFHNYNENDNLDYVLNLVKTKSSALVSDAGYPTISDPGYILVNACHENGIKVEVVSGPCALINAAVSSGMNLQNFLFIGFLNNNRNQRINKLKEIKNVIYPIIIYEAVHKIEHCLNDMLSILGDRKIVVCRELTKLNETIYRGKISQLINQINLKGEFVIIIMPEEHDNNITTNIVDLVKATIALAKKDNLKLKQAAKFIAESNHISSKMLYDEVVKTYKKDDSSK